MRITPLDVRKQDFARSMRGFDCDEVRAFLNTLADEYEAVLMDNKQIRERTLELEDKLGEYHHLEKNLRDTLLTAERLTQESREASAREGELIIREAEQKARGVMEECRLRTDELRRELIGLRREKETYLARFRSLAEAQIQFVDAHRTDFEDLDRRLGEIADSVVSHAMPAAPLPGPAPSPWNQPAAYGPAPAAPYAAPAPATSWGAPVAPYPHAAAPYAAPPAGPAPAYRSPVVAQPVSPPAPAAAPGRSDKWRDYVPGRSSHAQAATPAHPATPVPTASTAPTASSPIVPVGQTEEDVNGLIAHSLAETPGAAPESTVAGQENWRPEPVVTEVANV
jgi:cell division initiation protein